MSRKAVEESDTMRHPQGDLAILSAEVFPGLPFSNSADRQTTSSSKRPRATRKAPAPTQSSDEAPKKRAKTQQTVNDEGEGEDEEEKKRSRGRPRLDAKDESAADRRRTQIRLAQRAYRNRKETAISTLEKQVKELKDTNEEMSNAFMQLQDFALKNGLLDQVPALGRQLRETTEKFLSLARSAKKEQEDQQQGGHSETSSTSPTREMGTPAESNGAGELQPRPDQVSTTQPSYAGIVVAHEPVNQSNFVPDFSAPFNPPAVTTSVLGYEIVAHPTLDNASFAFQPDPSFNFFDPPASTPYNSLPAPKTYASHEGTFGRRLQRFALERAYVLIMMPNPPQSKVDRVFGFCLLFETTDAIKRRISRQLARNASEGLNNWEFPFYNLGGAGTHYDATADTSSHKIGNQGTLDVLKPNSTAGYGVGPFSAEVNGTRDNSLDQNMRMDEPGFGGDFFDCDEVEMYLYQRGVVIPPGTDFVTADIDPDHFDNSQPIRVNVDPFNPFAEIGSSGSADPSFFSMPSISPPHHAFPAAPRSPPPSLGSTGSASTLSNPSPPPPPHLSEAWSVPVSGIDPSLSAVYSQPGSYLGNQIPTTSAPMSQSDVLGGMFSISSHGGQCDGFDSFQVQATYTQTQHPPSRSKKQRIYFDVQKFVKAVVNHARCLGRTPGFRQRDVNDAFWAAASHINGL